MRNATAILAAATLLSSGCILIHEPDAGNPDRCPATMPDPGDRCLSWVDEGDSCTYGGLACQCGRPCQPAYGCQCVDGRWSCWHTDPIACPDEGVLPDGWQDVPPDVAPDVDPDARETCPGTEAANGTSCSEDGFSCEFGPQACQCGTCRPAFGCYCNAGTWACWHTDPYPDGWCQDVPPPDVTQDLAPVDAPYEYWSTDAPPTDAGTTDFVPPACCAKNADCGPGMACGTWGGSANGTCKPRAAFGQCWSQEDCATGSTCLGVAVCPCNADCDLVDQPGTCTALPSACCWVDGDCDAGFVCRNQGGMGGLPGACLPDPAGPRCPGDSACCWNDADCLGGTCQGALSCGCIDLCPVCGACAPDQMGTCAP